MNKRVIAIFLILAVIYTGIVSALAVPAQEKAANYIYYIGQDGSIKRVKKDLGEKKTLSTDSASYIKNVGDWIYYYRQIDKNMGDSPGKVYKIKFDGTGRKQIINDTINDMFVTDKYIYYTVYPNLEAGCKVYRVDFNGKGKVGIYSDGIGIRIFGTDGKYIYGYTTGGIFKMDFEGKNRISILKGEAVSAQYLGEGRIVYDDNISSYIMDTNGKNKIKINVQGTNIVYKENKIYWSNGQLLKSELNEKSKAVLAENVSGILCSDSGYIYYTDKAGKVCRVPIGKAESTSSGISVIQLKQYLSLKRTDAFKTLKIKSFDDGTLSVMDSDMFFPCVFLKDSGLTFIFRNMEDNDRPMYITVNRETNVKNINIKGAKPGMGFDEIMSRLGAGKVRKTWVGTEDDTAYVLEYKIDGVNYSFMSYDKKGTLSELYISL